MRTPSPTIPNPDQVEGWRIMMMHEALYSRLEVLLRLDEGERTLVTELKRWQVLEECDLTVAERNKISKMQLQLERALGDFDRACKNNGHDKAPPAAQERFNHEVVSVTQQWMCFVANKVRFTANEEFWARQPTREAFTWAWDEAFPQPCLKNQEERYAVYRKELREEIGEDLADRIEAEVKQGRAPPEVSTASERKSGKKAPRPKSNEHDFNSYGNPESPSSPLTPQYSMLDEGMEVDEVEGEGEGEGAQQSKAQEVETANTRVGSSNWFPGTLAHIPCAQCDRARTECKLRLNGTTGLPSACERCMARKIRCKGAVWWDLAHEMAVVEKVFGLKQSIDDSVVAVSTSSEPGMRELREEVVHLREDMGTLTTRIDSLHQEVAQVRALLVQLLARV